MHQLQSMWYDECIIHNNNIYINGNHTFQRIDEIAFYMKNKSSKLKHLCVFMSILMKSLEWQILKVNSCF